MRIALRFPFVLGRPGSSRPIFVVGCPRSGTTITASILATSAELVWLGQESHWIWERFNPPSKRPEYSQVVEPDDLTRWSKAFIRACYSGAFGAQRFFDKCPSNSLRVLAIKEAFPDAIFVCVTRNGPDNVSSLINTWRDEDDFSGFDVPLSLDIEGYGGRKWVHTLVPGWQEFINRPIEEVCAHQWLGINQYLLDVKGGIDAADWIDLRHEELVRQPERTVGELLEKLEIGFEGSTAEFVSTLSSRLVNTRAVSQPVIGKWKFENPERIRNVISMLRPMMNRLGYTTED